MLNKKNRFKLFIKELIPYIAIIILVIIIKTYIAVPAVVIGSSMEPTLQESDFLLLNKLDKKFDRYDIVVFNYKGEKLIKRVIGLPGETVEYKDKKLYINGVETYDKYASVTYQVGEFISKVPEDSYFLVGDNRNNSIDSRRIGPVNKEQIDGSIAFRIYPLKKLETYK